MTNFKSETISLGTFLFDSKVLKVPPYQRSYSWEDDQITDLWNDVIRMYKNSAQSTKEHFFGAVVLVQIEDEKDGYTVLDGQQRIVTSTVFLCIIRDMLKEFGHPQWTVIEDNWIGKRIYAPGSQKLRCKLTLNKYDKDFFKLEVQDMSDEKPEMSLESHKLIRKGKERILKNLREEIAGLEKDMACVALLNILEVLTRQMTLIKVSSKTMNDAASVFEILNNRGIGLSSSDLLKNYLMLHATDDEQDQMVNMWEEILQLGNKVDEFLIHYWKSIHGDLTDTLYNEITEHLESNRISSLKFCSSLVKSAGKYLEVLNEEHPNERIEIFFRAINLMGSKYMYPLVLSAIDKFHNENDLEKFLKNMLVLNTRYKLIGQGDNTPIESFFFNMAKDISNGKGVRDCIVEMKSGTHLSYSGSDDNIFKQEFLKAKIKTSKWARYILEEIERFNRSGELEIGGSGKVHVEHIYPQNPRSEDRWPDGEAHVDRIGNLALIKGSWNQKMQNKPFAEKKSRYLESEFIHITKPLARLSEWTSDEIDKRQKKLANIAVEIWKFDE